MIRSLVVLVPEDQFGSAAVHGEFHEHTRLCEELRREYKGPVETRVDRQDSDDSEAILLLLQDEPSKWMRLLAPSGRRALLSRTLVLRSRFAPGMLDMLEEFGLAGGVENRRYAIWKSQPERDSGYGIAGLRDVVVRLNGECAEAPFATARYCFYQTQKSRTLPAALAEYCTALAEASNLNPPTFGE